MKKRFLSCILAAALVLSCLSLGAFAGDADAAQEVASGQCGDDVYWTLTPDNVLTISGSGDMYYALYSSNPWYSYRSSIKTVVIEEGVTSISAYAFFYFTALESVEIPEGVTSIGFCAFYNCSSLESAQLPDSLVYVGAGAFLDCTSLTSITIPAGVSEIKADAFYYCTSLSSITFEGSAPECDEMVFANVWATVYYPADDDTWTDDVMDTLSTNASLTWVSYEAESAVSRTDDADDEKEQDTSGGVSEVASDQCGDDAYWTLTSDGVLTISGSGEMWDYQDNLSYYDYLEDVTEVVVEDGITYLGNSAFGNFFYLTSVTLADSVESIGPVAFCLCTALEDADLGNGVASIDYLGFANCESLTEIELPQSLTYIGYGAFQACSALAEVELPSGLETLCYQAFAWCSALENVTFSSDAPTVYGASEVEGITYSSGIFAGTNDITIYYPAGNDTWTSAIMSTISEDAEGTVSWVSYDADEDDDASAQDDTNAQEDSDGEETTEDPEGLAEDETAAGTDADEGADGAGTVSVESVVAEGTPDTSASVDEDALIDYVLTDEEKEILESGGLAEFTLAVSSADEDVSGEDLEIAKAFIAQESIIEEYGELTIGLCLDISLCLTITDSEGESAARSVSDTGTDYTITVTLPDELINTDENTQRTYYVIQIHDGKAQILEADYDAENGTITFEADKFSTYVVAYRDKTGQDADADAAEAGASKQSTDTAAAQADADAAEAGSKSASASANDSSSVGTSASETGAASETSSSSTEVTSVKTGDEAKVVFWLAAGILAAAAAVLLSAAAFRNRRTW